MKNRYEINGDIVTIHIKNRKGQEFEMFIDLEDFEKVNKHSWIVSIRYLTAYAATTIIKNKIKKKIEIHRFLMDYPKSIIDHINHNGLDNRRSNLRLVTPSENHQNLNPAIIINSSSGFRNVTWHKKCKKWQVHLKLNSRSIYLGLFEDVEEAKQVAINARKEYFPFAQ